MFEPNFMAIHLIIVETFHSKSKISTSWCCKRKSHAIRIHPLQTVNVCTKLQCSPQLLLRYFSLERSGGTNRPTGTAWATTIQFLQLQTFISQFNRSSSETPTMLFLIKQKKRDWQIKLKACYKLIKRRNRIKA